MIKYLIIASMILISCKQGGNNESNIKNNKNPEYTVNKDIEIPSNKKNTTPLTTPVEKSTIEQNYEDVDAVKEIYDEKNYIIDNAIYSDCSKKINDDICPTYINYNSINGDFKINVKKINYNTIKVTFSGIANLISIDNKSAQIDCTNETAFNLSFYNTSYSPHNVEYIKNECKKSGLIYIPYINPGINWLNKEYFMSWIGIASVDSYDYKKDGVAFTLKKIN